MKLVETKDIIAAISLLVTIIISIGGSAYTYGVLTTRVTALEGRADYTVAVTELRGKVNSLDVQLDRIERKVDALPR